MLPLELLAPGGCEPIEFRPPVVLGGFPFGGNPTLQLEPLQSGVQRSEFDVERFARATSNRLGNPITVQRNHSQRPEHQHIERSLEEVHMKIFYMKSAIITSPS